MAVGARQQHLAARGGVGAGQPLGHRRPVEGQRDRPAHADVGERRRDPALAVDEVQGPVVEGRGAYGEPRAFRGVRGVGVAGGGVLHLAGARGGQYGVGVADDVDDHGVEVPRLRPEVAGVALVHVGVAGDGGLPVVHVLAGAAAGGEQ